MKPLKTKVINRNEEDANKIFNNRSLTSDYRTLVPVLKSGMRVLDIGCGTGAISKDIAKIVGKNGSVTGIDVTEKFIESGKKMYPLSNLKLIHADLFEFEAEEKFDLIVAARTLQWLSHPKEALVKMKTLLKHNGQISVLDYNHEALELKPEPPQSMQYFYQQWLKWRADAGMNNHIAEDLPSYFEAVGLFSIEVINSDEIYKKGETVFEHKIGIWKKVASSTQVVEEGYISKEDQLKAIEEYSEWMKNDAVEMVMKLKEVRGRS